MAQLKHYLCSGQPAATVMYVEKGTVRLSIVSHMSKEAIIAVLGAGHFFGEAVQRASRSGW